VRELQFEANALATEHGENPYTDFLRRHGRRPDRLQASTIGQLMGVQVRAADGTLQPPVCAATKRRNVPQDHAIDQILRLRCALSNLAQNKGDPTVVIRYMDPLFGDAAVIREHLAHAVRWINRFAEEWDREQETRQGPRGV
jgi:hypothetical protein